MMVVVEGGLLVLAAMLLSLQDNIDTVREKVTTWLEAIVSTSLTMQILSFGSIDNYNAFLETALVRSQRAVASSRQTFKHPVH